MKTESGQMKTVREGWDTYLHEVIPKTAGPIQITESKLCYYAGATLLLGLATEIANMKDLDKARNAVLKLHNEISDFTKEKLNETISNLQK